MWMFRKICLHFRKRFVRRKTMEVFTNPIVLFANYCCLSGPQEKFITPSFCLKIDFAPALNSHIRASVWHNTGSQHLLSTIVLPVFSTKEEKTSNRNLLLLHLMKSIAFKTTYKYWLYLLHHTIYWSGVRACANIFNSMHSKFIWILLLRILIKNNLMKIKVTRTNGIVHKLLEK